jgi:hypothetical protein
MGVCYIEHLEGVCPVGTFNHHTVHCFKRSSFEVGESMYISYCLRINQPLESSQKPSRYVLFNKLHMFSLI